MRAAARNRLRRSLVGSTMLAVALAAVAVSPSVARRQTDAAADEPKVVIIVGPTGSLTDYFRRQAHAAANVAQRFTSDVTTIYSPWATWEAVRPALQGASIVVYMGHGNGWPSKYRDSLYRPTQNGLGLNPVAGGPDHVHRYYGEAYLAREVELAPGAVVLLHHLCYSAGNSEPGLPEGPIRVAKQRIDNYGAGWLATGAIGVVAEPYFAPRYYVQALLGSDRSLEQIWRASPSYNNNVEEFASVRTPGAVAFIDPDRRTGRYERSLVIVDEGRFPTDGRTRPPRDVPRDVLSDTTDLGDVPPDQTGVAETRPALAGAVVEGPMFHGPVIAGAEVRVSLPLSLRAASASPAVIEVTARWEPVDVGSATGVATGSARRVPATLVYGFLDVTVAAPSAAGQYRLELVVRDEFGRLGGRSGKTLARGVEVEVQPATGAATAPQAAD